MQEQTDNEQTDRFGEELIAHEYKNKGVKSERAASPAPSDVSLRTDWSMDPPANFKDFPLDTRVNSDRAPSPVPSYLSLKTDWSMDPPANFKDFSSDTRFEEDETTNSHQMDNSFLLKLLTEPHLKCPVCKSLLKDPVSISCGHNCCRDCINAFWDNCAGNYVCPQCGEASETRPLLNTNTALLEVVKNLQQAGFSPALPAQAYAGPQDLACDFCTETEQRLKAVKSCSNCGVFMCETHVRQHYTIPALQKHTLSDVTADMKTKHSQQIQSTENSNSGQQDQTHATQDLIKEEVRSIAESALKTAESHVPEEATESSASETRVDKVTDVTDATKLEQEMAGLQISHSKLTGQNAKRQKLYEDDDDDDYRDEDYGEENDNEVNEVDVDDNVDYVEEDFGTNNYNDEAVGWHDEVYPNDWEDDLKEDVDDVQDYTNDYYDNEDFRDSYDNYNDFDDY